MCNIYVSASRASYESTSRSVRIQGVVTSIRLENKFWQLLDQMAAREHFTTPQFINQLYTELMASQDGVTNFTSFLRVSCSIYLANPELQEAPLFAEAS
ncbi:MAG: ribbon-helix-helix domain-containing protein [Thiolinea sp.]